MGRRNTRVKIKGKLRRTRSSQYFSKQSWEATKGTRTHTNLQLLPGMWTPVMAIVYGDIHWNLLDFFF